VLFFPSSDNSDARYSREVEDEASESSKSKKSKRRGKEKTTEKRNNSVCIHRWCEFLARAIVIPHPNPSLAQGFRNHDCEKARDINTRWMYTLLFRFPRATSFFFFVANVKNKSRREVKNESAAI
jgi:hypothetical protein